MNQIKPAIILQYSHLIMIIKVAKYILPSLQLLSCLSLAESFAFFVPCTTIPRRHSTTQYPLDYHSIFNSRNSWIRSKKSHNKQRFSHIEDIVGNEQLAPVQSSENNIVTVSNGNNDGNQRKKETLRFGGEYSYKTEVFSLPSNISSSSDILYKFLSEEKIQHILLSGGTNSTIQKIPNDMLDEQLTSKWYVQADTMNGSRPNTKTDSVVKVTPPGIDILTVSIIPTTTIGTKLIQSEHSDGSKLPEFQATLIEDEPRAIGPKFFVWLFNKITFGRDPDAEADMDDENTTRRESAFFKLYVHKIDSEQNPTTSEDLTSFMFVAESTMWLEFEFPKLLLRFFPIKKSKAEALCSNAIVKALEKNMVPAMEAFCEEYRHFVK